MKRLSTTLICTASLWLGACQSSQPASVDTTEELAHIAAIQLMNASIPEHNVLCSGQPTPDQFDALVIAGYRNFICLRLANEPGGGWESARAASFGVQFHRLPIANSGGINESNATKLSRLMEEGTGPTVIYCRSGDRVGALYGAKLYLVDGVEPEEALALGRIAGVTRLEPRLIEILNP